jgi:hypothetical protein
MNLKQLVTCLLCAFVLSVPTKVQPLRSPAATASSYLERGNNWFVKGECEQALADRDSPPHADLCGGQADRDDGDIGRA